MTVKDIITKLYTKRKRRQKNTLDQKAIVSGAERLAAEAKNGTLKIPGEGTFSFKFDPNTWTYIVYDPKGNEFKTYNTKKLSVARKWLKEYFES